MLAIASSSASSTTFLPGSLPPGSLPSVLPPSILPFIASSLGNVLRSLGCAGLYRRPLRKPNMISRSRRRGSGPERPPVTPRNRPPLAAAPPESPHRAASSGPSEHEPQKPLAFDRHRQREPAAVELDLPGAPVAALDLRAALQPRVPQVERQFAPCSVRQRIPDR